MRRPGVRIPSRPPSFKTTSSVPNSSYRGTLGLNSLPDSFRYLVIHPERHCLSDASSVNTSLSDDTHSFERRTYSSRCLTSRNLCFEPSYNWSDKGFAHPSPEQRQ